MYVLSEYLIKQFNILNIIYHLLYKMHHLLISNICESCWDAYSIIIILKKRELQTSIMYR